jgi:hypothetical protein
MSQKKLLSAFTLGQMENDIENNYSLLGAWRLKPIHAQKSRNLPKYISNQSNIWLGLG